MTEKKTVEEEIKLLKYRVGKVERFNKMLYKYNRLFYAEIQELKTKLEAKKEQ